MEEVKAASLADVHSASNEPQVQQNVTAHTLGADDASQPYESDSVIFRLANSKKKGRVYIDGIADVVNPKTKKVERARLLAGVESIWMSEQKELDKDYVKQNRRSLIFEGRVCRIPKWDTSAIEFAKLTKHYIADPSTKTGGMYGYFEWNPQRQAEEEMRKENLRIEAMMMAAQAEEGKMKKHAIYLGISEADEMGIPKYPKAIRSEYVKKAEANPKAFIESYDSVVVNISFLVQKALREGKIDLGKERNRAYWSNNGGLICSIPAGRNAREALVDYATQKNNDGKDFLDKLELLEA